MYVVNYVHISPDNGMIVEHRSICASNDLEKARAAMKEAYLYKLKEFELEDNDACDGDEAVEGGYISADEAGIYMYADFAFGQLLELVSFTISEIDIS